MFNISLLASIQQWIRNYASMDTDAFVSSRYWNYAKYVRDGPIDEFWRVIKRECYCGNHFTDKAIFVK